MTATLEPASGSAQSLTFTVGTDSAACSLRGLATGYYDLTLQVLDGATKVAGLYESVRILKDQTTTFNLTLVSGTLGLTITPELQNPITVSFSGQQTQLPPSTDMIVTAATSLTPDSYQWYLDGVPLSGQTGSTLTYGSSLSQGRYRVDLAVKKGSIISSGSFAFTVLTAPTAVMESNIAATGQKLDIYFYGGSELTAHNTLYVAWVEDTNGAYLQDLFVLQRAGHELLSSQRGLGRPTAERPVLGAQGVYRGPVRPTWGTRATPRPVCTSGSRPSTRWGRGPFPPISTR